MQRGVRTTISTDRMVSRGLAFGLALSAVAWPLLGSLDRGVAVGGALGLLLAMVLESRRVAEVSVDEEAVRFHRRGHTEQVPHAEIRQVLAEPVDASGFRGKTDSVAITLLREGARPLRFEVASSEADGLLAAISAPMVRRWSASLARGEHLEFRDPRDFPTGAVLRGAGVALGALILLVSWLLAARYDLFFVVGMLGVSVSSAMNAARAVRAWRRADRGGGLAVSAQGVLHLEHVPRRRVSSAVYRASEASGPWIPWAALRAVRREGFGLVLETDTVPAQIQLSASTEGAAPLGLLLQRRREEHERESFFGHDRVRFDAASTEAPQGSEPAEVSAAAARRGA